MVDGSLFICKQAATSLLISVPFFYPSPTDWQHKQQRKRDSNTLALTLMENCSDSAYSLQSHRHFLRDSPQVQMTPRHKMRWDVKDRAVHYNGS